MKHQIEIDITESASKKGKAPLNKPFRLPKGNKKKFGVYVKNQKGNIVMVKFGDPNMSIKRDNPARRKAFRSRHSCDDNPGPKWKARYWSCRMWEAKKSVTDYTKGSCGKPNCGSVQNLEDEVTLEVDVQAKGKGLWYNIQQKKKRMGKNYRPAPEGSKDRPTQEALKKAQASDYLNEEYEWDGETEFEQKELLKINNSLAQVEEIEEGYIIKENFNGCPFAVVEEDEIEQCFDSKEKAQKYIDLDKEEEMLEEESKMPMEIVKDKEEEMKDYKEDFYGMIVGSINSIKTHAENILSKLDDPIVKENLTEPFLQQQAALAEDYIITIHNYVMFNKEEAEANCSNCENEEYKKMMVTEGQKLNEFLKQCIPTKQGDDKSKFKSCLEDYKNKNKK